MGTVHRPTEDEAIGNVMREMRLRDRVELYNTRAAGLRGWDIHIAELDRRAKQTEGATAIHRLLHIPSIYIQRRLTIVSSYLTLFQGDFNLLRRAARD